MLSSMEKAILWDMLWRRKQEKEAAEEEIQKIRSKLFEEEEDPYEY